MKKIRFFSLLALFFSAMLILRFARIESTSAAASRTSARMSADGNRIKKSAVERSTRAPVCKMLNKSVKMRNKMAIIRKRRI